MGKVRAWDFFYFIYFLSAYGAPTAAGSETHHFKNLFS